MKKSLNLIFLLCSIVSFAQNTTGTITDSRDGKVYKTVVIRTQTWMSENLNVSNFRNGDVILEAKTKEEWELAGYKKQPAWCYYENDPKNGAKYGKLYNWYAVNDPRGLAPAGWHVPSEAEWTISSDFLGGESTAGKQMKSLSGWNSYTDGGSKACPNCVSWTAEYRKKVPCHTCKDSRSVLAPKITHSGNGTNSSGFSALPGGSRGIFGDFVNIGDVCFWWSSTESSTLHAYARALSHIKDTLIKGNNGKEGGFSVRCVKN